MARLLLGVLIGAAATAAAAWWWTRGDDCLGRCGAETTCRDHRCVAAAHAPTVTPPARDRRRSRARSDLTPAAAEQQLHPGDEQPLAQGDALGRPERIDLSEAGDAPELTDQNLDDVFHASEPAILRCISDAVGDAPLDNGQVEVGLRVERNGSVSRVRVTAPTLLQRRGLTRCVRAVVTALRFPASGGASVVTYPFAIK
jgi:hypothetical protein